MILYSLETILKMIEDDMPDSLKQKFKEYLKIEARLLPNIGNPTVQRWEQKQIWRLNKI